MTRVKINNFNFNDYDNFVVAEGKGKVDFGFNLRDVVLAPNWLSFHVEIFIELDEEIITLFFDTG